MLFTAQLNSTVGVVTVLGASLGGVIVATSANCAPPPAPRGSGVFALLQPMIEESASAFGTDYANTTLYNSGGTLGTLGVNGIVLSIPWAMLNNDIASCSSPGTCTLTLYSANGASPTGSNSASNTATGTFIWTEAADARLPGSLDVVLSRLKTFLSNNQNTTLTIVLQAGAWTPLSPNPGGVTFPATNGVSINGSTTETLVPSPGHLVTSPFGGTLSLLQEIQATPPVLNGQVYATAADGSCYSIADPWNPTYVAEYNAALAALVNIIENQYNIHVPKVISISGMNERSGEFGFFGDLATGLMASNPTSVGMAVPASTVDASNCNSLSGTSNSERWHAEGYDPADLENGFAQITQEVTALLHGQGALSIALISGGGLPYVAAQNPGTSTAIPPYPNQPCLATGCVTVSGNPDVHPDFEDVLAETLIADLISSPTFAAPKGVTVAYTPAGSNTLTLALPEESVTESTVLSGFLPGQILSIGNGTTIVSSVSQTSQTTTLTSGNSVYTTLTISPSTTSTISAGTTIAVVTNPGHLVATRIEVQTDGLTASNTQTLEAGIPCTLAHLPTDPGANYFNRGTALGYQSQDIPGSQISDQGNFAILNAGMSLGAQHLELHWPQVTASAAYGTASAVYNATEFLTTRGTATMWTGYQYGTYVLGTECL